MFFTKFIREFNDKLFNAKQQTTQNVQLMQIAFFKAGFIVISSIVIVWISIFLYTAFYWAYMPSMIHMRPVHLEFE